MNLPHESEGRFLSRRDFLKVATGFALYPLAARLLPDVLASAEGQTGRALPIVRVQTDKPWVALTIDDGYDTAAVERFLTLTGCHAVTSTVFPVGNVMTDNPDLWQAVKAQGHEIGNHSHSHLDVSEAEKATIYRDFARFEQEDYPSAFSEDFPTSGLARVPYAQGPVNTAVQEVLYELGDLHVHWRRDSYSWKKKGKLTKENRTYALKNLEPVVRGDIIILHFNPLDMGIFTDVLELLDGRQLAPVPFTKLWKARKRKP